MPFQTSTTKPTDGNAEIVTGFNSITITTFAERNRFVVFFISFWLIGWFVGEVFALSILLSEDNQFMPKTFLTIWVVFWTIGGFLAIKLIAKQLFGKETIEINRGMITIANTILGIGKKRFYDIYKINKIGHSPYMQLSAYKPKFGFAKIGRKTGALKFCFDNKMVDFASNITKAEADYILDEMKKIPGFHPQDFDE